MRQEGVTNPDPRKRFWEDIEKEIEALQKEKHEILLMLYANDPDAKELQPIMQRLKMRDIHHFIHGNVDTPETHIRGSARIDFAYGTTGVLDSTRKAGIGAYNDICYTDHRHLFIDIDLGELLSGYPPDSSPRERRILESNNPRVV